MGFFLLIRKLKPEPTISLDTDWFYRMFGRAVQWLAKKPIQWIDNGVGEVYRRSGLQPLMRGSRLSNSFDNRAIDGVVDGFATGVRGVGDRLRLAQRGSMQENLTLLFAVSLVTILALLFFL